MHCTTSEKLIPWYSNGYTLLRANVGQSASSRRIASELTRKWCYSGLPKVCGQESGRIRMPRRRNRRHHSTIRDGHICKSPPAEIQHPHAPQTAFTHDTFDGFAGSFSTFKTHISRVPVVCPGTVFSVLRYLRQTTGYWGSSSTLPVASVIQFLSAILLSYILVVLLLGDSKLLGYSAVTSNFSEIPTMILRPIRRLFTHSKLSNSGAFGIPPSHVNPPPTIF